jgi:small subunit ribosomal protein S11
MLGRFISRCRGVHTSALRLGTDGREKRLGHIEQSDQLEGEHGTFNVSKSSYELVDENLMDKVINNVKFKDIPTITIRCTRNNTKIYLHHGNGTLIDRKTGGSEGFKNCRKGTTVAAQAVANRILTVLADNEIHMARMVFNGLGPGRNAAFKVFEMNNFNIVSLTDRTQAAEPWNRRPRATKSI